MRKINIKDKELAFTLRKSKRARNISLTVNSRAEVTLSLPWYLDETLAIRFLTKKAEWLFKKISFYENKKNAVPEASRKDYLKYKKLARQIAENKIEYFNRFFKYQVNKISIRNQKTRWGSCSRNGNLNFSYRIIYLSEELCDYIVVHELCHLKEFNHSRKFWDLVEKIIPNHKEIGKRIRIM